MNSFDIVSRLKELRYKWSSIWMYSILIIATLLAVLPLIWLIMSGLKTQAELFQHIWGLPQKFRIGNYIRAWQDSNMRYYMVNSLIVTGSTIVFTVVTAVPLAFALSRFNFKYNRLVYYIVIAGMMIPIQSAVIPLYTTTANWGLLNSRIWLALVYAAFRIPISVFILESFMNTVPVELEESAVIDGANVWQLFIKIFVPIIKNGILAVVVLAVIATWNELLVGLVMLTDNLLKTLPVGVAGFINRYGSNYSLMCAGVSIAFIPNLVFYMLMQNRIQKGMTLGALD